MFVLKTLSLRFFVVINSTGNSFAVQIDNAPTSNIRLHENKYVHNLQNAFRLATGKDLDLIINDYSTTIP
jgi:hypothetical protein